MKGDVFINHTKLRMKPGTVIARSFKGFDVFDPTSRYVTYTNTIRVEANEYNRLAFGILNDNQDSVAPYRFYDCRFIGVSGELFGIAVVSDIGEDIEFSVYFNEFALFNKVENKLITEIQFSDPTTQDYVTWSAANVNTYRNASSGVVAPFIQYGQVDLTQTSFNIGKTLPSYYYKSIIEKIFTDAGYTFEGPIFSEDQYTKLALPYSRDSIEYSTGGFRGQREFYAESRDSVAAPFGVTDTATALISFKEIQDNKVWDRYTNDSVYTTGTASVTRPDDREFFFDLYAEVSFTVHSGSVTFWFSTNIPSVAIGGKLIDSESEVYGVGTHTVRLHYRRTNPLVGPNFRVYVEDQSGLGTATLTVHDRRYYNKVQPIQTDLATADYKFRVEDMLPDTLCTDMLKDFCVRFGVVIFEQNKVLTCVKIDDMLKCKYGVTDLTSKRVAGVKSSTKPINNSYGQNNFFTYPSNDDLYIEGSGDYSFIVDNLNLEKNKDLHESLFNGSFQGTITNALPEDIEAVQIPVWDTPPANYAVPFNNSPGLRLVYLVGGVQPMEVKYNGTDRTDYLLASFFPYLDWANYINDNYPTFIKSLQKFKAVTRYYTLDEIFINQLKLYRIVYDTDAYYLINNISNYVEGQQPGTKIELFKIR